MYKLTGLITYKDRYYYRTRLPKELIGKVKGKHNGWGKNEIKIALGTSDKKEAYYKARKQIPIIDLLINQEKKILEKAKEINHVKRKVDLISDDEVILLVTKWFLGEQKKFKDWYAETGENLSDDEKKDYINELIIDAGAYSKATLHEDEVLQFDKKIVALLKEEGIELDKNSKIFEKLNGLFRRGNLELTERQIDYLSRGKSKIHDDLFWEYVQPNIEKNIKAKLKFVDLCKEFLEAQKLAKVREVTLRSYTAPIKAMEAVFCKDKLVKEITSDDVKKLAKFIKEIPVNATKKYPNLSLKKIVELTKDKDDVQKISPVTAKNYYKNVLAIFNFAVMKKFIKENPAKDRC